MPIIAALKQSLFRWQSDGSGTFQLGQRRVFILPTRAGCLFALALLVMLIGAINYNLSLGHALVFLLAGLGISGMIHTFRNLYQLIIKPGRCEAVFAGETAYFPVQLINDRPSARQVLRFSTESERKTEITLACSVAAHGTTEIALPLNARQRGWLALPRLCLSTDYPLGLFVAWSYLQPEMRCLVYPRPLASPLPCPLPVTASSARHAQRTGAGGQEDFAGFRERQPADSPRHVAWKASARNGGERPLLLKQFSGGAQTELLLDWALTAEDQSLETRLSLLTGWVLAADQTGLSYGLRLPGQEIKIGRGVLHRRQCLEILALFQR